MQSMSLLLLPHELLQQMSDTLDLSHPFFLATRETSLTGGNRREPITKLVNTMLEEGNIYVFEHISNHLYLYNRVKKNDRRFVILVLEYMIRVPFSQEQRFQSLFTQLTHYYIRSSQRKCLIDLHLYFKHVKDAKLAYWELLNMCSLKQLYNFKYRPYLTARRDLEYILGLE
jgi:hypothetical protein